MSALAPSDGRGASVLLYQEFAARRGSNHLFVQDFGDKERRNRMLQCPPSSIPKRAMGRDGMAWHLDQAGSRASGTYPQKRLHDPRQEVHFTTALREADRAPRRYGKCASSTKLLVLTGYPEEATSCSCARAAPAKLCPLIGEIGV